ncbi:hypothetical protein M501DRAFT_928723 [Patellaria atrata CBS 101060]|uniref:DUF1996 domain-containing protein n=1 Tax=Patellaria atrata CBS 101060 TaxID=1346257 RepID=A0A9P4SEP3_9PEZI|nr:hypothetical protein M501DRAFT_928723 [Patellaria atrata CBS 101060]
MKYSLANAALLALSLSEPATAFWRMRCPSRTGLARIDPLVDSGTAADHSHAIHGGKKIGFVTTTDDLLDSECSSCAVTADKSAYWHPVLTFQHANGSFEAVRQVGGILVYYLLHGENIQAFPKGFQMLSGDTRLRNFSLPVPDPPIAEWRGDAAEQWALRQKALGFNCLNYGRDAEASLYRHFMPDKDYTDANCADGVRFELMFPSCWNGEDLDTPDHKSHVAFPSFVMDGTCPEGFEKRVPSLFFETIYATQDYVGVDGQFVISNGDPTGYGFHGDFISGWEPSLLQEAVDTCTSLSGELSDCPVFQPYMQSDDDCVACNLDLPSELEDDDCAGPADALCGNVPVQYGPAYAQPLHQGSDAPAPTYTTPENTKSIVPSLSYAAGTHVVTDNYGAEMTAFNGQIQAAQVEATPVASSSEVHSPVVSATEAYVTPAPEVQVADVEDDDDANIVATTTYTSGGAVYIEEIEEVTIYTTVPAETPAGYRRRHIDYHRHNHGRNI